MPKDPGESITLSRPLPAGIAGNDTEAGTTTYGLQTDVIAGASLHAEYS